MADWFLITGRQPARTGCHLQRHRVLAIERTLFSIAFVVAVAVEIVLMTAGSPLAAERILSFRSHVTVNNDTSLTVREEIEVEAQGIEIKRGIFRDFPIQTKKRNGTKMRVGFTVTSVTRDGTELSYFQEKRGNSIRTYMARKDVLLDPGIYTYEIVYNTTRQLNFFEDYDELYWNVTGNDWSFVIDKAQAEIELPGGANVQHYTAFTGPAGTQLRIPMKTATDSDGKRPVVPI